MYNNAITVGIIGGTGGMGRLFARFFKERGYDVLISSRKTELTPEECAAESDIVVVTVPIASTIETIKKIAPRVKKSGVLMDLTSLKSREVAAMLENSECEVIGCHPVFGPSVASFENQVIVMTPARGDIWLSRLSDAFKEAGAIVKISTPEMHDEQMSIVQGLMHFTSITLVDTLKRMGADVDEINNFSSPVYRMRSDFAHRILNQDPELYADIALRNPSTIKALRAYLDSTLTLIKIIENGDRAGFISKFRECADFLGDDKKEAEERTNKIIDFVSNMVKSENRQN